MGLSQAPWTEQLTEVLSVLGGVLTPYRAATVGSLWLSTPGRLQRAHYPERGLSAFKKLL